MPLRTGTSAYGILYLASAIGFRSGGPYQNRIYEPPFQGQELIVLSDSTQQTARTRLPSYSEPCLVYRHIEDATPVRGRRKRYQPYLRLWPNPPSGSSLGRPLSLGPLLTLYQCDQASPACARCTRLKIPCVGQGQLRYRFKEQFTASKSPPQTVQLVRRQTAFQLHTTPPANEIDSLSHRLVSALQVTEPRYDVSALGTWFEEVPSRLGRNELFDTSTAAFIYAIEDLRTQTQTPSVGALSKYGKALNSLATTLQNPTKAKEPYTLASIFMLMVSQVRTCLC